MGIEKIDPELCIGCEACVDNCPMDVLRMNETGIACIAYPADCMECYACEDSCPVEAIEISPQSKRKLWFSFEIEKS
ncbi:ferredoxin family protein [Chloroflexota bacterium]